MPEVARSIPSPLLLLLFGMSFLLLTCAREEPSLCDCLTTYYRDDPGGCDSVFEKQYDTDLPSARQMIDDYVNCKDSKLSGS